MAEHYSGGKEEWISARYQLIDEVLEYRRSGILSQSLLDACEAEFRVASWAHSEGVRRMVELARDGHDVPAARLEELMSSTDWRIRYEAIRTSFERTKEPGARRQLVRRGLAGRSTRIRSRMASEAAMAHLIDMADEIERAAGVETDAKTAEAIFSEGYFLRLNERTGVRGSTGGSVQVFEDLAAAWKRFAAEHRAKPV
jgi:hypothetical protein